MQDAADDAADYDAAETGADAAPDAAVAPAFDPEAVPASAERFPMGVRAGDATGEGAVFATRFDGGDPLVLTDFADGQGPGAIAAEARAVAGEAGDVYVELAGLAAGTWYRYAFRQAGGSPAFRSPLGRIRTALPDTSLEPVVFGACSCTKAAYAPFGAIGEAAADALDFFLLLGDTVYADGSHSLADYRASWQETVGRPEYAALLGSTGIMATWDDHEVANNWNPETHPAAEVAAAKQALLEHLPIRRHPEGRLWRSYRWGRTLEVFILDCRGERKPSTRQGPDAQYISPEQLAWLQEALAGSPAAFKIIANSVPITDMPPLYVSEDDRWEGYAAQREALLGFIADQGIGGVVFLAGDFHFPCVAHIEPPDAPLHPVYEILCGPGAQIPNPAWLILTGDGIFGNQFEWASAVNNYTRFIADPSDMTLAVEFVTPTGTVEYSTVLSIA